MRLKRLALGPRLLIFLACGPTARIAWPRIAKSRVSDLQTHTRPNDWSNVSIRITGWPSSSTATVTWRDANSCFYGDQLSRFAIARTTGMCTPSGHRIARREAVYHPRRGNRSTRAR
jgi:hypothetical protein